MKSKHLSELIDSDFLPKSWEKKRLDEVAYINRNTSNLREYDWINYTDISSVGTRTVDKPSIIKVGDAPSRARRVLRKGDTVISTVRPNRKSFFYFAGEWENAIASTGFAVLSPINFEDSEYLNAILTSDPAVRFYENICEGGAYPAFNPSRLAEFVVPWPPKQTRIALGKTVMNFQLKIEVNNALSKTLGDIAQTIFKSWFIDFDPVKAKMAGEQPAGMDDATVALFPDSMEESELGLIPEGWNVSGLNEFAKPRKELAKVSSLDSQTNYVGLEHLPRNSLFFRTWSSAEKVQSGKSVFKRNDILFGKLRPYFHKVVVSPVCGVCSTDIVVIQSPDSRIDPYTACLVYQDEFITFVTNRSSGTRMPRTSWQEMCEFKIAFPGLDLMQKFNELMEPLFSFAISFCLESNELETIRETLLPRLISGELPIPEEMLAS